MFVIFCSSYSPISLLTHACCNIFLEPFFGDSYVDVLKLFLVATRAAYQKKIPLPQLIDLVSACPIQTANRPLSDQEIEVRSMWLNLGYLTLSTLEQMEHTTSGEKISFDWDMEISSAVQDQYSIAAQGAIKRERGEGVEGAEVSLSDNDPLQAAIYKTNLRVIDLTLTVVKEERLANESSGLDGDGVGPPRPNIPGAYK